MLGQQVLVGAGCLRRHWCGCQPRAGMPRGCPHLLLAEPGDAAAVVRGEAADIDAWLWKRRDDSGIEVSGDRRVYDAMIRAVNEPLT